MVSIQGWFLAGPRIANNEESPETRPSRCCTLVILCPLAETRAPMLVYFLSSLRGQTAKTLICTKSGVSADSRKSAEKCRKVRRTALFAQKVYKKCAKNAVLRTFRHFSALFLEPAETQLFVQINVFCRLASEARQEIHNPMLRARRSLSLRPLTR